MIQKFILQVGEQRPDGFKKTERIIFELRRRSEAKNFCDTDRRRNAEFSRMREREKFEDVEGKKIVALQSRAGERRMTDDSLFFMQQDFRLRVIDHFYFAVRHQDRGMRRVHRHKRYGRKGERKPFCYMGFLRFRGRQ